MHPFNAVLYSPQESILICSDQCLFSSYNYETGKISEDVAEQTEQTMINIEKALREAGSSMSEVVRVKYILLERNDFPSVWPVLRKWLGNVRPAATMVQAALMLDEMKIEIEVTAKKGSGNDVSGGQGPSP